MPPATAAKKKKDQQLAAAREKGAKIVEAQALQNRVESLTLELASAQSMTAELEEKLKLEQNRLCAAREKITQLSKNLAEEKSRAEKWYRELRNERRTRQRAQKRKTILEEQIELLRKASSEHARSHKDKERTLAKDLQNAMDSLTRVEKENSSLRSKLSISLERARNEMQLTSHKMSDLNRQLHNTRSAVRRLRKKANTTQAQHQHRIALAAAKEVKKKSIFHLKHKGVYTQETRNLVRVLVDAGCSQDYIGDVIHAVLKSAGITAIGGLSRRTVSRIIVEGYVASCVQLGYEMKETKSMTFSADGTGHRNINYNSRHVNLDVRNYGSETDPDTKEKATRFLGIMPSLDGTSEQSIKDWETTLQELTDIFNRSPLGQKYDSLLRTVDIFAKLSGMMTDHCAKEKKDVAALERKKLEAMYQKLGEAKQLEEDVQNLVPNFLDAFDRTVRSVGGKRKWNKLTTEQQQEQLAQMSEKLVIELGKEVFETLNEAQKRLLKLFIWAGCGCHKELNTVRAGYAAMSSFYSDNNIEGGPVLLANRDNAAVLEDMATAGDEVTPAQERAFENTARGAIKAATLAGAVLNHKDDKKGYHDTFRIWWLEHVGTDFTFPDTSNTRFQSYCEAAAYLILYREEFIQFLEFIRDRKNQIRFSNMEKNLYEALHCPYTLAELAVLALYAQSVTHPYMRIIRSPNNSLNMLDLGPFHTEVKQHVQAIIADPDLLIGDNVSYTTGSLDGQEWHMPNVVEAIQKAKSSYPHFRELLIRFFEGAADGWERFTSEFAPGGLIDEATSEEKDLAWLPTTNDVNEGALGSFRVLMRRQPQLKPTHYNARAMFKHNNTGAFMKEMFEEEDHQFIRDEARKMSGRDQKRMSEITRHQQQRVASRHLRAKIRKEKAAERAAQVEATRIELDPEKIFVTRGQALKLQLQVYRVAGAPNLNSINSKSKVLEIQTALKEAALLNQSPDTCWAPLDLLDDEEFEDMGLEDGWEDDDN